MLHKKVPAKMSFSVDGPLVIVTPNRARGEFDNTQHFGVIPAFLALAEFNQVSRRLNSLASCFQARQVAFGLSTRNLSAGFEPCLTVVMRRHLNFITKIDADVDDRIIASSLVMNDSSSPETRPKKGQNAAKKMLFERSFLPQCVTCRTAAFTCKF